MNVTDNLIASPICPRTGKSISFKDCLKTPQFFLIYGMVTMSIFIGMFTINTFKNYGMKNFNDNDYLTTVGAVSAVFGGIRFVWSYLVDAYSFKVSYGIVLIMNVIFGGTLVLASKYKALYLIWVSMIVWAEGAHFSLLPTICAKLFG
jgi:hypothetical protein